MINSHIINRQPCLAKDRENLIQYLKQTPVAWVAEKIVRGAFVSKGEIQSKAALGSLTTIFSDLGGILAIQRNNREKFLVSEVLPALRDSQCKDEYFLKKVENYMKLDEANSLEIKITLCKIGDVYMIVDGNKRATAIYERRLENNFKSVVVYLVSC